MKFMKKILFLALALLALPSAYAVPVNTLEQIFVDAPLKHPIAFCVPMLLNAATYAPLYALKNYQKVVSPFWAYATLPCITIGYFCVQNRQEDKPAPALTMIASGFLAGLITITCFTGLGLLTIKLTT